MLVWTISVAFWMSCRLFLVHFMKMIKRNKLFWDFHGVIEFLKRLSHKLSEMAPNLWLQFVISTTDL